MHFTITFTEFEEVRSLIWHLIHAHSKKGFVVITMMYMLGGVQNHLQERLSEQACHTLFTTGKDPRQDLSNGQSVVAVHYSFHSRL